MKNRPIGIFDSGLGGLTAVKELLNILPNENIIYFGDTGRVPYGSKSRDTILKYAIQDIEFLKSMNVKMIIAACGTVSSIIGGSNVNIDIPFTGVVEPTAMAASASTKNGKIGIIGTTATIKSGAYKHALKKINSSFNVFEQDCPMFVPLVENGFIKDNDKAALIIAEKYLYSLREKGIDTLILGCTHYPIIKKLISKVMGPTVKLIDSGSETALFAANLLYSLDYISTRNTKGVCSFFVSDTVEGFSKTASLFLGRNINQDVKIVDIDSYTI